jgi:hypothetical protein
MRTEPHDLIDRSLKVLTRHAAHAFCRLAGVAVAPHQIRFEDSAVNLAEFRADQILLLGEEGDPGRWGWHLEFQIEPDARVVGGWLLKNAAFNERLGIPVVLTVVYLTRGDRATFPDSYAIEGGGRRNEHLFDIICLWEHADEIRSGALAELAPLLVLCENNPTEATLRRARELILGLGAPPAVQSEMLAVAMTVGLRYFARELLRAVFQEEIGMLKEVEFIRELFAEEFAAAEAAVAQAEARGEARGEAAAARRQLLRQLREKFGELPQSAVDRVERADPAECEEWAVRLLRVQSLEELGLLDNGGSPA